MSTDDDDVTFVCVKKKQQICHPAEDYNLDVCRGLDSWEQHVAFLEIHAETVDSKYEMRIAKLQEALKKLTSERDREVAKIESAYETALKELAKEKRGIAESKEEGK